MSRRPGFDRSDFIGTSGPGLSKLRAARDSGKLQPDRLQRGNSKASGLAALAQAMEEKRWEDAILLASKWSDLGDHAAAIHRGREAILRPAFQRQLRRDPAEMIEEAKQALIERYSR